MMTVPHKSICFFLFCLPLKFEHQTPILLALFSKNQKKNPNQIGVVRGFQLVKDETDPETGQQYQLTHDDFVEAAQRCLAIEEEMYVPFLCA